MSHDLKFGDYVRIEQKRYGCPNEMYMYKVINSKKSNSWVEVPVEGSNNKEVIHHSLEDVVSCICCGIDEREVQHFRIIDVVKIEIKDS